MNPDDLHTFVRTELAAAGDPAKVADMQRYMKTDMPFFGVSRPQLRPIQRAAFQRFPPTDAASWEAGVRALWRGPERELKYVAIAFAKPRRGQVYLTPGAVPLLEFLVRDGAWWDFVDEIAADCVGRVVRDHRTAMRPVLQRWIADDDVWVRRAAILAQLKHREDTDLDLLLTFVRRCASDPSFWIRKAIGWALRQHARTDPDAVRAFLSAEGHTLSALSRREASKHLHRVDASGSTP